MKYIQTYESFLNESTIMIFSYAKSYTDRDADEMRGRIDDLIYKLQRMNKNVHTGADGLYFPKYKEYGPTIAVRAGETVFMKPIDSDKIFAVNEKFLARFMQDGRLEGFLLPGTEK